ncbi:MAG: hypothetical protein RIC55_36425 [Pirellulaceae bacterium]
MVHFFLRKSLLAAACCCLLSATAQLSFADGGAACGYGNGYGANGRGQGFPIYGTYNNSYCEPRGYGRPDLFYNFYVPGRCGGYPVEMYPAPKPTPPIVGHVYYTYQPFMPHEMMYRHNRHYFNLYDGGRGLNHTTVRWW